MKPPNIKYQPEYPDTLRKRAVSNRKERFFATAAEVSRLFDVCREIVYTWAKTYPEFRSAWDDARVVANKRAVAAIYELAEGQDREERVTTTYPDGRIVTRVTTRRDPPDVNALKFILTNRVPEEWANKQTIDTTITTSSTDEIRSIVDEIKQQGPDARRLFVERLRKDIESEETGPAAD